MELPIDEEVLKEDSDDGLENVLNDIAEYEKIVKRMKDESENQVLNNILEMQ